MAEDWHKVAELEDIPKGKMHPVVVDTNYILLYNVNGKILATRDLCPHQAFPLSKGHLAGNRVTCGLHGWQFKVDTGECLINPAIKVRTFPVKVEGEDVFVQVEA